MAMVVSTRNIRRRRQPNAREVSAPVHRIAAQVANSVLLNRAEHKVFTFNFAFATAPVAGSMTPITQTLIQGDNLDNRSGDKITLTSIDLSYNTAIGTGAVASTVRFILFYDTMANGAVPTAADLLETVSILGRYNPVNVLKHRFRILVDWTIPVVATASNHVVHKEFSSKSRTPVFYAAGTSIAGANSKNAMFSLLLSDTAVNPPGAGYSLQLQYTDN